MEEPQNIIEEKLSFVGDHRFGALIIISIIITFVLVSVSLALYNSSGAAQLDLSRPGYNDIRDKVEKSDDFINYSSIGVVNSSTISEFKIMFNEKASKIKSVDIFGGDPLSSAALGLTTELVDAIQ